MAVLMVGLVGCSRKSGIDKATTKLQKSFQSADTATQSAVTKAIVAIQSETYPEATAALEKLAKQTTLTQDQQQAIKDTLGQIAKVVAEEAKKAGKEAQKAVGDMQKALPK